VVIVSPRINKGQAQSNFLNTYGWSDMFSKNGGFLT